MAFSSKLPHGVRRLFRLPVSRTRLLREMDDEMRTHLAMRADELRTLGMTDADAQAEALRRFGDSGEFHAYVERRVARQARWNGMIEWLAAWRQDIHFAGRQFRKAPGFTAVAMLTLALGIGANTAIFTVVHHLLLAPLPYPNGNRIVMPMQEDSHGFLTPADRALVQAWQTRGQSVEMIAGAEVGTLPVRPDGTPDTISYAAMTSNYLRVLGVQPALGRAFTPNEERADAAAVAMVSYGWWQRAKAGRADILGSVVHVNGKPYTVVGVTPPGLAIPVSHDRAPDIWLPGSLQSRDEGDWRWESLQPFAKLRRGASVDAATRELQAIAPSVPVKGEPRARAGGARGRLRAMRAQDFLDKREVRTVQVLFVAVGALLLIACANVANLLLSRAWTRRREFAVRIALGAGRGRLMRQVLTESVMLALAGGMLGVIVAWQTLRIIIALRPPSLDDLAGVHIEPAVLLWSLIISVATGILFGCAPALFAGARMRGLGDVLRSETRASSGGTISRRVRSALIVLEIAMSLVLLVSAGLLVRSFMELQRMPLGFEPRGLVWINILGGSDPRLGALPGLRAAIFERLRALPGVSEVAGGFMPGINGSEGLETDADGRMTQVPLSGTSFVSPNYFRVARIALVEGRLPDSAVSTPQWTKARDGLSAEVVVNRSLARRLFPNGHAVGSRVRELPRHPSPRHVPPWVTVVGVVEDIHMPGLHDDSNTLEVYGLTPPQYDLLSFIVRPGTSDAGAVRTIHRAAASVDRQLVFQDEFTGETYLRDSLAPTRFAMALLTAFAVLALVLSAVGLYGVIAYTVSQRTREIGIRVALGAEPKRVARLVIGGGLRLAAGGVVLGAVVAAVITRALTSLLYAVTPADPVTFAIIVPLVAAIAVAASYVPARRALRIDPTEALRAD
jgi:putative ABC transport system permease protein